VQVAAHDALGRPVLADYGLFGAADTLTAAVGMSAASGLWRVAANQRDIRRATTLGTGELIRHAVERAGARRILVGLGGSATNDGGVGMAHALGVRFLDGRGEVLDPWPAGIGGLAAIDEAGRIELPEVVAACDVDHPLLGERGASAVFGPQKGAGPEDVAWLERVLGRLVEVADAERLAEVPGAGAAGGLGFGLLRFAAARLESGFDVVAAALGLARRIAAADLVITGEGSLDAQTLGGKGPAGVAGMAALAGVPVVAVAGRSDAAVRASGRFAEVLDLACYGVPAADSMQRGAELVARRIGDAAGLLRRLAGR
jgi:glycerate kinase